MGPRSPLPALLLAPVLACAAAGDPADPDMGGETSDCAVNSAMPEADSEFADAIADLRGENDAADTSSAAEPGCAGSDESGDFGFIPKPCSVFKRWLEIGDDVKKLGVVLGVEGEAVLGSGTGFGGYDLVFDLGHHQMSVSRYKGLGIGPPGVAVGGQIYMGVAMGFEHSVADWDGYFVNGSLEVDIDEYIPVAGWFTDLGLAFTGYLTGKDNDGNNVIGPTEILLPPNGVYGLNAGIKAGVGLEIEDLDLIPLSVGISEGYWEPHNPWIRQFYDYYTSGWFPIKARLVDHHDGSACPEGWPNVSPEKGCVIEFGDPKSSHVKRSLDTARAICSVTGSCANPVSWPLATLAVAIGALNSSGLSLSSFCPAPGGSGGSGH